MNLKYIVYREGTQCFSRCLNIEIASCGNSAQEAVVALKEALELYFEDNDDKTFSLIEDASVGELALNA